MSERGSSLRTRRLLARVIAALAALAATLLTVVSAMFHGSHAAARLEGPSGWTGWVVLDVLLVPAPIVLPAATYAFRRRGARDRQAELDLSLAIWLGTAFLTCVLAVFGF